MKKTKVAERLPKEVLEQLKEWDDCITIPKSEISYEVVKNYIDMYNSISGSDLYVSSKPKYLLIANKSAIKSDSFSYKVSKMSSNDLIGLKVVTRYKSEQVWYSIQKVLPDLTQGGEMIRVPTDHIHSTILRERIRDYNLEHDTKYIIRVSSYGRNEDKSNSSHNCIMLDLPFYDTYDYEYSVNKASPNVVKRLDDLNIKDFEVNQSIFIPERLIPAQMVRNYATACGKFVDCKFSVNKILKDNVEGVVITRIC